MLNHQKKKHLKKMTLMKNDSSAAGAAQTMLTKQLTIAPRLQKILFKMTVFVGHTDIVDCKLVETTQSLALQK